MLRSPLIAKLYAGQGKNVRDMDSIPILHNTEVHQLESLRLVTFRAHEILLLNDEALKKKKAACACTHTHVTTQKDRK